MSEQVTNPQVVALPLAEQRVKFPAKQGGGWVIATRLRQAAITTCMQIARFDGGPVSSIKLTEVCARGAVVAVEGLVVDTYTGKPLANGKDGELARVSVDGSLKLCGEELIDAVNEETLAKISVWTRTGTLGEDAEGKSVTSPDGSTGGG